MLKNNKYLKEYQLKKIQQIKNKNKYIYIYNYNDLSNKEIISLKKKLLKKNIKFLILKQNLIKKLFLNIKGQGSILFIYNNSLILDDLIKTNKIKLLNIIVKNNIFSNLKVNKINNKTSLNFVLLNSIFNLIFYLKKINTKKAGIT